jgi:peptidoglycan L-alanyl-D-glutamate endopeptidase CwlK
MPAFSQKSIDRLSTCHKDIQVIFNEVIEYWDCTISCGFRPEEEQNKAYAEGKSKLRWPNGNHNKYPSNAVDVYPYPVDLFPKNQRDAEIYKYRMAYFAGFVMEKAKQLKAQGKIAHELRWGCDWNGDTEIKDHTFLDFPHFELVL